MTAMFAVSHAALEGAPPVLFQLFLVLPG